MRKFIAMSAIAAMAVMGSASEAELRAELDALKEQVKQIKIHDSGDNIKFSANLRTAVDSIEATRASGKKDTSANLMTNRLILNMSAQPAENLTFNGALSYNKVFGANPPANGSATGMPQRGYGFDTFDWVISENLIDNALRVKEASWFYYGDIGVPMTVSVGRRPATDGFGANYREGEPKAKSPQAHSINVEYDGASVLFKELTDFGTSIKVCAGRGLTNARSRFNMEGGLTSYGDYTESDATIKSIDMYGLIVVPYDDGQYKLSMMPFKATNLPGFSMVDGGLGMDMTSSPGEFVVTPGNTGMISSLAPIVDATGKFQGMTATGMNAGNMTMKSMGDMEGLSVSFEAQGLGDGISDFTDDMTFFASYAMSKMKPNTDNSSMNLGAFDGMKGMTFLADGGAVDTVQEMIGQIDQNSDGTLSNAELTAAGMADTTAGMLGSTDEEVGTSIWIGMTFPAVVTDGRFGVEYNQGSQYWRSMTYGEDTLAASKLAARGTATEVYYKQPIVGDNLRAQVRYTAISYTHTGSQGFFGNDGMPLEIDEAKAMGMDPVEKVTDIRFSVTYDY